MSSSLNTVLATPFGDDSDPRGFWRLLLQHVEHLELANYAAGTVRSRAKYVRAFALWCLDRDLSQPAHITKPILKASNVTCTAIAKTTTNRCRGEARTCISRKSTSSSAIWSNTITCHSTRRVNSNYRSNPSRFPRRFSQRMKRNEC